MSGRLVDASHCLATTGFITEAVTKVVGTLEVELTGVPAVGSLTAALADAFDVEREYVFVTFSAKSGSGARLLSGARSAPLRFLASVINVQYEVVVPPNTTKTEGEMVAAASALSEPQSPIGQTFSQSMLDSGVTVVSVAQSEDPVPVQSVIVMDETGAVVNPTQAAPSINIPQIKEADVDIAAVVGGVVAGLTLLAVAGALVHYFMPRRKVESSDDATGCNLAV